MKTNPANRRTTDYNKNFSNYLLCLTTISNIPLICKTETMSYWILSFFFKTENSIVPQHTHTHTHTHTQRTRTHILRWREYSKMKSPATWKKLGASQNLKLIPLAWVMNYSKISYRHYLERISIACKKISKSVRKSVSTLFISNTIIMYKATSSAF